MPAMAVEPSIPPVIDIALRDGSTVHVRPSGSSDVEALAAFLAGLSPRASWFRFLGRRHRHGQRGAWARRARRRSARDGRSGRRDHRARLLHPEAPGRAEVAFAVGDAWQGRGIATLLLVQLTEPADAAGIATLTALVPSEQPSQAARLPRLGLLDRGDRRARRAACAVSLATAPPRAYARSWSCRPASARPGPKAAPARRSCWASAATVACGSSAPTAPVCRTPIPPCGRTLRPGSRAGGRIALGSQSGLRDRGARAGRASRPRSVLIRFDGRQGRPLGLRQRGLPRLETTAVPVELGSRLHRSCLEHGHAPPGRMGLLTGVTSRRAIVR